jgi:RIO kinase 1
VNANSVKQIERMPNRPYLDSSVQWRIDSGNLSLEEPDYAAVVEAILSAGLATEVVGLISAGKEANVYLARYNGAPLAIKSYRLYRTSHRGGGPVKQDSMGWRAAHEYEMMRQAWKGGVRVPTPARRVENRFSMRYLGTGEGPAPRLQEVRLDNPGEFLHRVLDGVRRLTDAGVVHGDLSAFNILIHEGHPFFIDFSEAIRVDRAGTSPWIRLTEARTALERGLSALQVYFRRYRVQIDVAACASELVESLDRFGVLR